MAGCKHRTRDLDPSGYQRQLRRNNPQRYLWRMAKARARRYGVSFSILPEDIRVPSHCPVFGIPLIISETGRHQDNSPSVDRRDSTKGYVRGNVEVVSWKANRLKNNATPEELMILARYYGKKARKSTAAKNTKSTGEEL